MPIELINSTFHVAAIAIEAGNAVALSHLTPTGPSVILIAGIFNLSSGLDAKPVPPNNSIFS